MKKLEVVPMVTTVLMVLIVSGLLWWGLIELIAWRVVARLGL